MSASSPVTPNPAIKRDCAGGAFVTYLAVDGSGYVRVIAPDAKGAASQMSATEEAFDYVEHVVLGLRSITYYGKAQ